MVTLRRRAHRTAASLALAELRRTTRLAREDLAVMGFRLDDAAATTDQDASSAWKRAADSYATARALMRTATGRDDLVVIRALLQDGWFHLACSEALAVGCDPPTRADPCYFNPQHGPAVTEVTWSTPGGQPRPTAVCRIDAVRIDSGLAPRYRLRSDLLVARAEGADPHRDLLALNLAVGWTAGMFQPTHRYSGR